MLRPATLALLVVAACHAAPEKGPPPAPVVTEEEARSKRLACTFTAGALPADTLPSDAPVGDKMPLEHIVLVMQENRSFDHYFSKLTHGGVKVAPDGVTNPDSTGALVPRHHATRLCTEDAEHSWKASHRQWNEGKHDGFVLTNEPRGERAMAYYDESDLPFYYGLARSFAISDQHFCSLLGPTWPNRRFYFAGTSFGVLVNLPSPPEDPNGKPYPNLFTALNKAKVPWKVYSQGLPSPAIFPVTYADNQEKFFPVEEFFKDLDADTLPPFSLVEAHYGIGASRSDEHAPGDIELGQEFSAKVVRAFTSAKAWPKSALLITWDEHGGYYDSAPPPPACVPDALEPRLAEGEPPARFDRLGFRVPLIAVSPYAKRGHVSHQVTDHTSVLRFVETRFNLPALTARDANAEPLLDMFDFTKQDLTVPQLPDTRVRAAELEQCKKEFPDKL